MALLPSSQLDVTEEEEAAARADTVAGPSTPRPLSTFDEEVMRRAVRARMFGAEDALKIGRYELLHRIGRGGMGVVYAAVDRELERTIAIKLLLPGRVTGEERMLREARALAKLAHPNVVTVHEVGTHEGQVFVAMELVEGPSLRQWLDEPRPRDAVLDVFLQAARGLRAAHGAGLVHRDFKPDNVILGRDGRARVLDFGLAKAAGLDDRSEPASDTPDDSDIPATLTRTGQLIGTPAYMAPEQMLGRPVDARADVFAFCVALFEALTGQRPFPGDDVIAIHDAVRKGPPSLPGVPSELATAIEAGLAFDPDDRSPSLERVVAGIESALQPRPRSSRPRARMLAAVAVAALGGAAALAILSNGPQDPPPIPPVPVVTMPSIPVVPPPPEIADAASGRSLDSPVCTPLAPERASERSCDDLLVYFRDDASANDDEDARCWFAQFCRAPDDLECPPGTKAHETVGCIDDTQCTQREDDRLPACLAGDLHCCADLSVEWREYADNSELRRDDELAAAQRLQAWLYSAPACDRGDNLACLAASSLASRYELAVGTLASFARACTRGHLQACRRVARIGEKAPDPATRPLAIRCALEVSPDCFIANRSAAWLERMAECGAVASEEPVGTFDTDTKRIFAGFEVPTDISEKERVRLDAAAKIYQTWVEGELRELYRVLGGKASRLRKLDRPALKKAVVELADARRNRVLDLAYRQKIADERAGFAPAKRVLFGGFDPEPDFDPVERHIRFEAELGAVLERAVALELGEARARQLHDLYGGWPDAAGSLHVMGDCPGS